MDYQLPDQLVKYPAELDDFIERETVPLDHRRARRRRVDHQRGEDLQLRHASRPGGSSLRAHRR